MVLATAAAALLTVSAGQLRGRGFNYIVLCCAVLWFLQRSANHLLPPHRVVCRCLDVCALVCGCALTHELCVCVDMCVYACGGRVCCRYGSGLGCVKQHPVGREAEGWGLGLVFRAYEGLNPKFKPGIL